MLALLRRRPELRRLFLAHAVSRAGDAFNSVALVVLVYRLTGSGLGVAASDAGGENRSECGAGVPGPALGPRDR